MDESGGNMQHVHNFVGFSAQFNPTTYPVDSASKGLDPAHREKLYAPAQVLQLGS